MNSNGQGLTRRDFIKGVGIAAVGSAVGLPAVAREPRAAQSPSRVVLIRHPDVITSGRRRNAELIQRMLNDALVALFGLETPSDCWKLIIKPDDIVGIKTNVWRYLPTPLEVERAIRRGLYSAGVQDRNIGIGDRDVLRQRIFRRTTALINSRPMRTHAWSGVGSLIKNYIMFYPDPEDFHPDACANLAKLWELPIVRGKTRLNILVMLTPQFHNLGPHHFDRAYVWPYRGLIVSTDPVAADAVGLRIIQEQRRRAFGAERRLRPTAHHIALADTEHHLGNADMSRIDLVKLGWEEDRLI